MQCYHFSREIFRHKEELMFWIGTNNYTPLYPLFYRDEFCVDKCNSFATKWNNIKYIIYYWTWPSNSKAYKTRASDYNFRWAISTNIKTTAKRTLTIFNKLLDLFFAN
jgi:hypothetical protein